MAGKLYDKIGMKPLAVFGCAFVFIIEILVLLLTTETSSSYILIFPLVLLGFGMAFVMMNMATYAMARTAGAAKMDGTAILTCLRTIGGALGASGFVAVMSIGVQNENYTMADVSRSYIGMSVLAALALFLAIFFVKSIKNRMFKKQSTLPEYRDWKAGIVIR